MWKVEFTEQFEAWWNTLSEGEQKSVAYGVNLLMAKGPFLERPYVDTLKGSRHSNMKELRS